MFKRKVYDQLLEWKKEWNGKYACLLEGARRVGKTTIAEEFARNEYESYILIDFSNTSKEMIDIFDDISKLDRFFLRLQMETGVELHERKSVIIFDEIQLFPKARQAIKHLVKDGRYDYIETGSLISIKKNVKNILIPSEEHKIRVYPMDYEEFLWATGGNPNVLNMAYRSNMELGNEANRNAMKDLYENVVAHAIRASGRDLYYHTWKKEGSTHSFEIDFLITSKNKIVPIEVKSSATWAFVVSLGLSHKARKCP